LVPLGYPGLGARLRARILEQYGSVAQFTQQRGYSSVYVYRWFRGMMPTYPHVMRLAADLQVTPAWLLFGDAANAIPPRSGTAPASKERAQSPVALPEGYLRQVLGDALRQLPPATAEALVADLLRPTKRGRKRR
jgi:transcriptional regulator with XRE-family HTH domain